MKNAVTPTQTRFFACVTWKPNEGTLECLPVGFAPFLFPCGTLEGVVWSVYNVNGVDTNALSVEVEELISTLIAFDVDFTVLRNRFI